MKSLFSLFLVLSLSACGGGGGGSTQPSQDIPKTSPTAPLVEYIDIDSSYLGKTNQAEIIQGSIESFFHYFFFINPELLPRYFEEREPDDIGMNCIEGGTFSISDTDIEDEKNINFTNCAENGTVMTGEATIRANAFQTDQYANNYGEATDTTLIFKDVSLKTSFGEFLIKGTMEQIDTTPNTCPSTEATYNMVLNHINSDHQIYFNNVKAKRAGTPQQSCTVGEGISSSGTIYDSTLGYWIFGTTELFKTESFIHHYLSDEQGEITIHGANDSVAKWSIKSFKIYSEEQDLFEDNTFYELDIDSNDDIYDSTYKYFKDYFSLDLLTSLVDSDLDGMTDVWELYFGLDMNNPNDAMDDDDFDGFTNLEEFSQLGNPDNAAIKPWIGDISISLEQLPSERIVNNLNYIDVPVLLTINNILDTKMLENIITFKLSEPFKFVELPRGRDCLINEASEQMDCTFERILESTTILLYIRSPTENLSSLSGEISASISSSYLDKNIDNNIASTEFSIDVINVPYLVANGRPYNIALALNEVANFELKITHKDESINDSLFVELESPSHIEVLEAQCKLTNDYNDLWTECLDGNKIELTNEGYLNTKFTVQSLSEGQGYLTLKVKSAKTENLILKEIQFPVIYGRSVDAIQDQIEIAEPNTTISVESGIYVGRIQTRNKENLVIKSLSGPENTFLYGHLNSTSGGDPISLDADSTISGFTISGMSIYVDHTGANIIDNIFDSNSFNFRAPSITSYGSLNFLQNKTLIGYKKDPKDVLKKDKQCQELNLNPSNANDLTRNVKIVNNLVVGVDNSNEQSGCRFIKLASSFNEYSIAVENNTIVNINKIFNVTDLNPKNTTSFKNNIFYNSRIVFEGNQAGTIRSENNLFSHIFRKFQHEITETGSVVGDPLFNPNWNLLIDSPAIDSGISTTLIIDNKGQKRPVDGNDDGVSEIDIGAFEYQGNN